MTTNVNANRIPVLWADLLKLCSSCDLSIKESPSNDLYGFWRDGKNVIHQVGRFQGDHFRNQGYFSGKFGESGDKWRGQPTTARGQIRVIETINPSAPMTKEDQPAFWEVVEFVLNRKNTKFKSSKEIGIVF